MGIDWTQDKQQDLCIKYCLAGLVRAGIAPKSCGWFKLAMPEHARGTRTQVTHRSTDDLNYRIALSGFWCNNQPHYTIIITIIVHNILRASRSRAVEFAFTKFTASRHKPTNPIITRCSDVVFAPLSIFTSGTVHTECLQLELCRDLWRDNCSRNDRKEICQPHSEMSDKPSSLSPQAAKSIAVCWIFTFPQSLQFSMRRVHKTIMIH